MNKEQLYSTFNSSAFTGRTGYDSSKSCNEKKIEDKRLSKKTKEKILINKMAKKIDLLELKIESLEVKITEKCKYNSNSVIF